MSTCKVERVEERKIDRHNEEEDEGAEEEEDAWNTEGARAHRYVCWRGTRDDVDVWSKGRRGASKRPFSVARSFMDWHQ